MIVYKITNKLNGMSYIGCTIRSLKDRWNQHCWTNPTNQIIGNDIKKLGKNSFSIEILHEYKNKQDALDAESYFIDYYNCLFPNGYNLYSGGKNPKMHLDTKKKIGKANLGKNNGMYGIIRSEESRLKQSKKMRGRTLSESHKQALRKPKSEEHRKKLQENLKRLASMGVNKKNHTRDKSGKFQKSE